MVMQGAVERVAAGLSDLTMGMPVSGKAYTIEEIHIFRLEDGRIAEYWHQLDTMGMMRQLGALPTSPRE